MISALDALVEARIGEAQQRGDFDDLPGAGRPLALEDDALVPEELRAAWRLLRNAGHVPPELERACTLSGLLAHAVGGAVSASDAASRPLDSGSERGRRRLLALTLALESHGGLGRGAIEYHAFVAERLAGGRAGRAD